jgi:hypothetical protein
MKQFAHNFRQLSILSQTSARAVAQFEVNSGDMEQSFQGWSDAANGDVVLSMSENRRAAVVLFNRQRLTSVDSIRVDRATVREGKTHRHWPREVVEKFLAAEVIRSK